MADAAHLSELALDEAAAGDTLDAAAKDHLASCEPCRSAVEARRAASAALLATPEAQRRLAAVAGPASGAAPRGSEAASATPMEGALRWLLIASLPLAAVLTLFVLPHGGGSATRVKGAATVELVDQHGEPTFTPKPGDVVSLTVGTGGHGYGTVMAVDENGAVTQIWPENKDSTAPIADGARVTLLRGVEITPGSFVLHAFFTDEPTPVRPFAEELLGLAQLSKQVREPVMEVRARAPGAQAQAVQRIEVAP